WIDEPDNKQNASSDGLSREIVLSPKLKELCQRSFGLGLKRPQHRPGISEWAEKLHAAADATVNCPACEGSYYFSKKICPWCDEPRPAFALLHLTLWDHENQKVFTKPNDKKVLIGQLALTEAESQNIGKRWLSGQMQSIDIPRLHAEIKNQYLVLRSLNDREYLLKTTKGEETLRQGERFLDLSKAEQYQLHLDTLDKPHRVIRFAYHTTSLKYQNENT
ncbi:hypothetical protein, partial [Candidatus Venteria ishoeyi]